ncbi:hypothetical protein BKA70DRAFT_1283782, partial [Coprinopsis sp. MPI-PUGE-AT-0042]
MVTAIPPNHSPDGITGSGSLTSPSSTPPKTTSDSRKEKGFTLATLYFMIPRLFMDTPARPKPHLHLPPGFLANQFERETAQALEGVATVFGAWDHCFQCVEVSHRPGVRWTIENSPLVSHRCIVASTLTRIIVLQGDWTGRRERESRAALTRIPPLVAPDSLITTSESTNV